MKKVLVTGFTPFDGREHNASWIAAQALAAEPWPGVTLYAQMIPVCWNAPRAMLEPLVGDWKPQVIISLGEGEPGVFRLETQAHNTRKERADNRGLFPEGAVIEQDGPACHTASADLELLQQSLTAQGIPVRLSDDAGAFLCEEMLYTLEGLKLQFPGVDTVLFVHVPPYGTELTYQGVSRQCDQALLRDFARTLLQCIVQGR